MSRNPVETETPPSDPYRPAAEDGPTPRRSSRLAGSVPLASGVSLAVAGLCVLMSIVAFVAGAPLGGIAWGLGSIITVAAGLSYAAVARDRLDAHPELSGTRAVERGQGLFRSTGNVLWGFVMLAVGLFVIVVGFVDGLSCVLAH